MAPFIGEYLKKEFADIKLPISLNKEAMTKISADVLCDL
jgi:hypothetical protein